MSMSTNRACESCPKGYASIYGQSDCKECQVGKFAAEYVTETQTNAKSCSLCPAGKYGNSVTMIEERLTAIAACESCVAGKYSSAEGADSIDACVGCQPGKKGDIAITGADDGSSCTPCEARTYSNQGGQTSCKNCGDDETSKSGSTFCTPSGSKMCDDGSSSGCTDSKAIFEACTAGTYGEVPPSNQCLECPTGYSSSKAATECQPW